MRTKWKVVDQARFLKRTGELLSRGYPLAEALESLSFYLEKKKKKDITDSLQRLREGYPFYDILEQLKFRKELISYVYFAEQHGGLTMAVIEGSEMVLKREGDYKRLKRLAAYPVFLAFLTGILFYFVQHLLLPKFTELYTDMDLAPNLFIRIVTLSSSLFPLLFSALMTAGLLAIGHHFFFFRQLSAVSKRIMLTRIPVAGKLLKLYYTHTFSIQLSYLISGGLSVFDALKVFEDNVHEPLSIELGRGIITKLSRGMDFDRAISEYPLFEKELSRIVRHGQVNGKLDQELYFYSRHCLDELEERTDGLLKIIQPLLYSLIGLLVISLYLAILLPMFQLIQGI